MRTRSQLRMIRSAILQGWQTPADEREKSISFVLEVLEGGKPYEKKSALRVLQSLIESEIATDAETKKRLNDALRYHLAENRSPDYPRIDVH